MRTGFGWTLHGDGTTPRPGEAVAPHERLTWGRTIGFGVQHVVAMFGATFVFPVLMGLDPNLAVLVSGAATILFLLIVQGRIPSYLGSSASFVGAVAAIRAGGGDSGAVTGAILVSGLVLGAVGLVVHFVGAEVVHRLLPPVLSGAVVLLIGTAIAVAAAPGLVWLYVRDGGKASPQLATAFAYLLLPQILFYGISALVSAILQAKQIFSPPAWAPVVNNLVVIGTICVYYTLPGELTINPVRMSDAHLLTLGIGVTLGVVAQAFIQVPALRRTGFRFRWRWGWDPRLNEFGGLTLWMLAYVGVSQIGLMVMSGVGTRAVVWSMYNYVWMLLQLPYGVIGFSVMTAILPRMSGAAADHDYPRVVADLSLGNRLSTVALLPISGVMSAVGVPLALALFSVGKSSGDAGQIGIALAASAFGVLPYAITMMQMRVFYALKDARTPTLIMVVMTVFKVGAALLCGLLQDPNLVLYGLVFVNSFSFVVGWVVGEFWLRHRLGPLDGRRFAVTFGKTLLASVLGGLATWLVVLGVDAVTPGAAGIGTGWVQLVLGGLLGLAATFGLMALLRVRELEPAFARVTGMLRR